MAECDILDPSVIFKYLNGPLIKGSRKNIPGTSRPYTIKEEVCCWEAPSQTYNDFITGVTQTYNEMCLRDRTWSGYITKLFKSCLSGGTGGSSGDTIYVTGGTAVVGTSTLTFTNSSGGTFNVSNGNVLFNDAFVSGGTLDAGTGCVTFRNTSGGTFQVCGFDGFTSYWSANTFGISNSGLTNENVGIGTSTPNKPLTVVGDISGTTALYLGRDDIFISGETQVNGDLSIHSGDDIELYAGDDIVFNTDCRIKFTELNSQSPSLEFELDNGPGIAFIQNGQENTVIAITSADTRLYFNDIGGEYIVGDGTNLTIAAGTDIFLNGDVNVSGFLGVTGKTYLGTIDPAGGGYTADKILVAQNGGEVEYLTIAQLKDDIADADYWSGNTDGSISNSGLTTTKVGIGSNTPTHKLHVKGNSASDDPVKLETVQTGRGYVLVIDDAGVVYKSKSTSGAISASTVEVTGDVKASGKVTGATLDISGDADIDGTITGNLTGEVTGNASTATKINSITNSNIVQLTDTQTLTNKTLTSPALTTPVLGTPASGTLTNCTGYPAGQLPSNIDATKIADGSVTDTEFQYISTLSSNAQTQITARLQLAGGTMSGAIAMGTNKITGMGDPTSAQDAATKAYVDTQVGTSDTLQEVTDNGATTTNSITTAGLTSNGAVTVGVDDTGHDVKFFGATSGKYLLWDESDDALELTDNTRLKFGAGDDLQIYSDGTNGRVSVGSGLLQVQGDTLDFTDGGATSYLFRGVAAGAVSLYYSGVKKLDTTNTGIDVTGEVKGDSLDIDGNSQLDGTLTVGVDDTGYDVKFFGATSGQYMLWDESADKLIVTGEIEATTFDGALEGNADTATKIASITNSNIVQLTDTQTLTNKTLTSPTLTTPVLGTPASGDLSNCTGYPAGQLPSNIDATKIADGSVTNTEFQYINTLSSNAQTQITARLQLAGGTMSGAIAMGTNKITGMGDPTAAQDAATKAYVDTQVGANNDLQEVTDNGASTTNSISTAGLTSSDIVDITNTTDASDATGDTGALRTEGGASIAKKLYVGTGIVGDLTGDVTGNADTATKIASITNSNIVQLTDTQTLTNKTLTSPTLTTPVLGTPASGDLSNCTGYPAGQLPSNIDATKIADGSVTNTEFQYINTLSSNAQTQLDTKLPLGGGTMTGNITMTNGTSIIGTELKIDCSQDLTLDAGGGDIILSDDDTIFGTISSSSGTALQIRSRINNADMFLRGVDGGVEFTALRLDMSAAGTATFSSDVLVSTGVVQISSDGANWAKLEESGSGDFTITSVDDIRLDSGGNDIVLRGASSSEFGRLTNSSQDFVIQNITSDKDIILKGNDGGATITALTLDISEAGKAIFNAGATFAGEVAMGTSKITGMGDPTSNQDAATKAYVDSQVGASDTLQEVTDNGASTTNSISTAGLTSSGVVDITDTTDASDATGDTGALRTEGGVSIAKKLYVGSTITGDLTGDVTGNADTATKIASITNSNIVQLTDTQTLTNKTLTSPTLTTPVLGTPQSGDLSNCTGYPAGQLPSNIDATKIADGSVTNTEFQYINTLSSNAQTQITARLQLAGGTMSGAIAMGTNKITGMGNPTSDQDAATKAYVDTQVEGSDTLQEVTDNGATTTNSITVAGLTTSGNITLNGDSDKIILGAGGDGEIYVDTDNLIISNTTSDKDILFNGKDDGSDITALTLDMSTGGMATFSNSIVATFDLKIGDNRYIGSASDPDAIRIAANGLVTFTAGLAGDLTGDVTGNADTATKIASITNSNIVQLTDTQTLTNKTLTSPTLTTPVLGTPSSGNLSNCTGYPAAQLPSSIDATKIADGSVTNTEFQYINTLSSNAQTQLDSKLPKAGGTMSGAIAMGTSKITGMGDPTSNQDAATKAYVDSQVGANNDLQEVTDNGATTTNSITTAGLTSNGAVTVGVDDTGYDVKFFGATASKFMLWDESEDALELTDNTRLKFGAGDDLQIYSDSTNGRITAGSGVLQIEADTLDFTDGAATEFYIRCVANGAVSLYHNANEKIVTTANGINVTGEVKGDSLDIDGNSQLDGTLTVGVDDTGYDVKFFGATSGQYMLWDESEDKLIVTGEIEATTFDGALEGNADTATKIASITNSNIVQLTDTQTLTNKTLTSPTLTTPVLGTPSSGNLSNCTGYPASALPSSIDATKIADGSVTNTEFQYINTLASNAQTQITARLQLAGGTMSGAIAMGTNKITGMGDPTAAQDAATKAYVDTQVGGSDTLQEVTDNGATTTNSISTAGLTSSGVVDITDTTDASDDSGDTGALRVEGGVSIAKKIYVGTSITTGNATLTSAELDISSGDFLLDVAGDITLDANGADIILSDDGTDFGRFKRDTSDFIIKAETNNKDILLKGVDNSSTITALQLDMSEAGKAIFNAGATFAGEVAMGSNKITGVSDPTSNQDAATKAYVDANAGGSPTLQDVTTNGATSNVAITLSNTLTVGVDGTGHDVKFFGDTSGKYMEWDESADTLVVAGTLDVNGDADISGSLKFAATNTSTNSTHYCLFKVSGTGNVINKTNGYSFNPSTDKLMLGGALGLEGQAETISSTGDLTLDSGADIVIDAAGGNIEFKDAGTLALTIDIDSTAGDAIFKDAGSTEIFRIDGSADSLLMASGKKIEFGDSGEYISGDGTDLRIASGADILLIPTGEVGIGTLTPITKLDVHHNPTGISSGTGGGEVVSFGTLQGEVAAGMLVYLSSSGVWTAADADASASSTYLLGIALVSAESGDSVQVLIRGFYNILADYLQGTFRAGQPCYISETAGAVDFTIPSAAGDFVRIVGHATTTANVIYFHPSNDYIELG